MIIEPDALLKKWSDAIHYKPQSCRCLMCGKRWTTYKVEDEKHECNITPTTHDNGYLNTQG